MHRETRALLHCVALFSLLLSHGNAAKGPAPSEVLTHFARAVGTVVLPNIAGEQAQNRSEVEAPPVAANRRQVGTRQVLPQDGSDDAPEQSTPASGGVNQQYPNQGGFPLHLGAGGYRNFQQLIGQNLIYPNAAGPFDGQFPGGDPRLVGLDPRLLQQFAALGNYGPGQQQQQQPIPKPLNPIGSNLNTINGNLKDTGSVNINSIQDGDTKSSAQSPQPFDLQSFQGGIGPGNIGNIGSTVGVGGYRGYTGQIGYPQQQSNNNNFFNGIGAFGSGGGSPYQYQTSQLNYGGGYTAGVGGGGSGLGIGGESSYFGNSFYGQGGPYQGSQGGFNFQGGNAGVGGNGGQGFPGNFQFAQGGISGADGGGFNTGGGGANFFQGLAGGGFGGLGGFGGGDSPGGGFDTGGSGAGSEFTGSSLRATAAKETANEASSDQQHQKVFLQAKRREFGDKTRSSSRRS